MRSNQNANQWDNVKGAALFHRAYRYLDLIWEYGKAFDESTSSSDLGVVLRLTSDPTVVSTRASVKEVYDRILIDAKESLKYLPKQSQHVFRPSQAAAYGLLARTYLSMRNYDSAFRYSDMCLQERNSLIDYNTTSIDLNGMPPFYGFNEEIIFYTTQSNNHQNKDPYSSYVDTALYDSFDEDDLRKLAYFFENNGYHSFKGTYCPFSVNELFTGIAVDELYLIRAECQIRRRVPDLQAGLNDLNTLLEKRWATGTFVPISVNDLQEALRIILIERRKELLMRGLRWIDIKRLNKDQPNIVLSRKLDQLYSLPPNSLKYALPLPKDIIEIAKIPQNAGWQ